MGIGLAFGPLLGGLITNHIGWQLDLSASIYRSRC